MRATVAVPSAPRMDWPVSIWISKPIRPSGRPCAFSKASTSRTIAVTCSQYVTLGSVRTRPSGRPPFSIRPVRKTSKVRMARSRTGASKHFMRMPVYGAAVPSLYEAATRRAARAA
ncbi:hypothetical protein SSPIM334S_08030 [Streptomyces spiroverticillatus]